jgi:hypothetical protein
VRDKAATAARLVSERAMVIGFSCDCDVLSMKRLYSQPY